MRFLSGTYDISRGGDQSMRVTRGMWEYLYIEGKMCIGLGYVGSSRSQKV